MTKRTYLVGLCLNLLVAIAGICISLRGPWHSWDTLVYLGKFDKPLGEFDSIVNTALSRSEHTFAWLFVGFMIFLVMNSYLLFGLYSKTNDNHDA